MTVADKTPLRFDYDSNSTPSALAEFTASDVVGVTNGGTGASSLADFGGSLSSVTVQSLVASATDVSADEINGMPYPPPFSYIQLTADDALSTDQKKVAYSNTPTITNSNQSYLSWTDSTKQFNVSAAGTYEVMGVITFEGGATLVEIEVRKNGSAMLTVTPRVHSTVDPVERTIRAMFTAVAGDNMDITYDAQSGNSVKAITGSTVTVKRVK